MKHFAVAALVAAVLTITGAASARPFSPEGGPVTVQGNTSNPGGWSLTGYGAFRVPLTNTLTAAANVSAHSDVGGLNAKGQMHLFFTNILDSKADIRCLFVAGNRAGVLGLLEHPATLGSTVYPYGGISVTDNGPASSTPRDQVTFWVSTIAVQPTCVFIATSGGLSPITNGNFVVNDPPPGSPLGPVTPSIPTGARVVALN
jgi:hypothetical protein